MAGGAREAPQAVHRRWVYARPPASQVWWRLPFQFSVLSPGTACPPCTPTLGSPRSRPWHEYWGSGDLREHSEKGVRQTDVSCHCLNCSCETSETVPSPPPAPSFSCPRRFYAVLLLSPRHPEDHVNVPRDCISPQVSVISVTSQPAAGGAHMCPQRAWPQQIVATLLLWPQKLEDGCWSLIPATQQAPGTGVCRASDRQPRPFCQDADAAAEVPGPVHGPPADPPGRLEAEGQGHGPPGSPARGPGAGKSLRDRPLRSGRWFKEVEIAKGRPRDHRSA